MIISFLFVLVLSLFLNVGNCLADQIGSDLNNDFSNKSKSNNIKNKINDKTDTPKASN